MSGELDSFCESIKHKAIQPAKDEAKKILGQAKSDADKIVNDAMDRAEQIINAAKTKHQDILDRAKTESIAAAKSIVTKLKSDIEEQLFHGTFIKELSKHYKSKDFLMPIAKSIAHVIQKNGLNADIAVLVSKEVDINAIAKELVGVVFRSLDSCDLKYMNVTNKADDKKLFVEISVESLDSIFWPMIRSEIRTSVFGI